MTISQTCVPTGPRPELPLARLFIHLMLSDRFRLDRLGRFVQVGEVKQGSLGLPLLQSQEHRWVWKWGWTTPKQLAIQIGIMRMIQWSLEVPNFKTNPWKNMRNPVGHQWTGSGVSPVTGLIGPNVVACE